MPSLTYKQGGWSSTEGQDEIVIKVEVHGGLDTLYVRQQDQFNLTIC
jgi:hypothetical protein